MAKLNDTLKNGIQLYTGRVVKSLDVYADPQMTGLHAMQATMDDGKMLQFLVSPGFQARNAKEVVDYLEEVEFTEWPPVSGGFQVFCLKQTV